jgi:SAM-dependent methyltransferase
MSTIDTVPVDEAAVEEAVEHLVTDLGATLGVLLTSLGTRSGLWAALAGAGPLTVDAVAAKVAVHPALVRDWLGAQAAGGYLTYDRATGGYALPEAVAAALVEGPGGPMVEACVSMLTSMAAGFDDFSTAFCSGGGFGWHQRTPAHWRGTDQFARVAMPAEAIAAVVSAADLGRALDEGARVVDVGCGYGAPTIALASLHPAADVLGVDYHDASVAAAREAAGRAGVDNVRFEVAPAASLPVEGVDVLTFFDALHDMGDPRGVLTRARSALGPHGVVLLVEPLGGDDVADNLTPAGRMFYAVSAMACTPNAVAQSGPAASPPLGAQAGEQALRRVAAEAGFGSVRRLDVPLPLNLVLELRP